jgi:hypothetical protein
MNEKQLRMALVKLMDIILPKEVIDIDYDIEPTDTKDEYYMSVTYIVPDDSQYLRSNNMRQSDLFRMELNDELKRNIWAYLNVRVIINSTGIRSESYNERVNERVNESDTKQNDAIQKLNKFFL